MPLILQCTPAALVPECVKDGLARLGVPYEIEILARDGEHCPLCGRGGLVNQWEVLGALECGFCSKLCWVRRTDDGLTRTSTDDPAKRRIE